MNVNASPTKIIQPPKGTTKKKCFPHLPSPKTLLELCGDVLEREPLPRTWDWDVDQVSCWLNNIGFPQYQEAFRVNKIDGRKLLRVDAPGLIRMNIHDFDDIKKLTAAIRYVGGLQIEKANRRISEPPWEPHTYYILYRTNHNISCMEFFYCTNIVQKPRPPVDHWDKIEPCPPKYPPDQYKVHIPFRYHICDWSKKQTKCVEVTDRRNHFT